MNKTIEELINYLESQERTFEIDGLKLSKTTRIIPLSFTPTIDIEVVRLSDKEISIISKIEELGYTTYVIGKEEVITNEAFDKYTKNSPTSAYFKSA